jgi:hypothetical protein
MSLSTMTTTRFEEGVMAKIFISYRRTDSAMVSGRIYDRLIAKVGRDNVFKDVDDIPPGVRFPAYIQESLRQCSVELLIIGRAWLSAPAEDGTRRLDDPADFVRQEIETGLALGLVVIPVLVDGASLPTTASLPESLRELHEINAIEIRNDPDFNRDMERLLVAVERVFAAPPKVSSVRLIQHPEKADRTTSFVVEPPPEEIPAARPVTPELAFNPAIVTLDARVVPAVSLEPPQAPDRQGALWPEPRATLPSQDMSSPRRQEGMAVPRPTAPPQSSTPPRQSPIAEHVSEAQRFAAAPIPAIPHRQVVPPAGAAPERPPLGLSRRVLLVGAGVVVIVLLSGGWYFTLGPYAQMHAATQRLQAAITNTRLVVSQSEQLPPASALAKLSQARAQLVSDLGNSQADPQLRQTAQHLLATQLVSAVQNAVERYDNATSILAVAGSDVELNSVSCVAPGSQAGTPLSTASSLVAVAPTGQTPGTPLASGQILYAVNSGTLYQLVAPLNTSSGKTAKGTVNCNSIPLTNVASVVTLATAGETLFVLAQQNATTYEVLIYGPNGTSPSGQPVIHLTARFGVPTPNGAVPTLIGGQGSTTYVAYSMTGGTGGIWIFHGTNPNGPAKTIPLTQAASSIVATSGTLYAILADGSLGQLDATPIYQPIELHIQNPLIPNISPSTYTSATPVPTVTSPSTGNINSNTTFRHGAMLASDANAPTTVYVGDGSVNRVVHLTASGSGPGLGYTNQVTYSAPLENMQELALAANGPVLNVYGWNGSQLASFSISESTVAG